MKSLRSFFRLAISYPKHFVLITLLLLVDVVFSVISVVSIAPVADLTLDHPKNEWLPITNSISEIFSYIGVTFNLLSAVILLAVSMLLLAFIGFVVKYYTERAQQDVVASILEKSLNKIFLADWSFFITTRHGDLVNTFTLEVKKIGGAFSSIANLIAIVARVGALVTVPLLLAPELVSSVLALAILIIIPFLYLGKLSYAFGLQNIKASNRFLDAISQSLHGAKDIIIYHIQARVTYDILQAFRDHARSVVNTRSFTFGMQQLYEPLAVFILLGAIVFAKNDGYEISSLTIVLWALMRAIPPLKQVIQLKHQLDNCLPAFEQLDTIMINSAKHYLDEGHHSIGDDMLGFRLENVSYSYPDGTPALHNINLEIKPGKVTALVGESGSGKSTLFDLMLGLIRPTTGRVLINRLVLSEVDRSELRSKISVVTQSPFFFNRSIKENICWNDKSPSDEKIMRLCRLVGISDFIENRPNGLDANMGDSGLHLSGGQRQRIAIARALLREPKVLFLDEATNALDSRSEASLYSTMLEEVQETTVLIIAHRLSTIRRADIIYVFKRGKLIEQGTYNELINIDGYFKSLADHELAK